MNDHNIWQMILNEAVKVGALILLTILMAVGKKLLSKLHLSNTNDLNQLYDLIVEKSIHAAEEYAHKQINEKVKPSGNQKMNYAVEFAFKMFQDSGLEEKSVDWVKGQIESRLGMSRGPSLESVVGVLAEPVKAEPSVVVAVDAETKS